MSVSSLLLACVAAFAQEIPEHPRELVEPPLPQWLPPRPTVGPLEGGGRMLFLPASDLPLVDVRIEFGCGTIDEPNDRAGLATVLAAALRESGSATISGEELESFLDQRGASIAFAAELERFRVELSCLAEDFEDVFGLAVDLLAHPSYRSEVVDICRARVVAELEREAHDPASLADRLLACAAYGPDSPWARAATAETLAAVDVTALSAFHTRFIGRERMWIGITGDLDQRTVFALVDELCGPLPEQAEASGVPAPAFLEHEQRTILLHDAGATAAQTHLRIVGPGVRRLHPDYPALYLWSHVVGVGGMTHRMMARVRTELGLAYSVGAFYRAGWGRAGRFEAYCATRTTEAARALEEMLAVLEGSRAAVPAAELDSTRERIRNAQLFEVDSEIEILERALALDVNGYPADFWETRMHEGLFSLTPEDLVNALERHLTPANASIVAVGPAALLESELARFGRVVRVDDRGRPIPQRAIEPPQVERMFAALGGRERWAALESFHRRGRVTFPAAAGTQPTVAPLATWQTFGPARARLEVELAGTTTVIASDGPSCWSAVGDMVEPLAEDECRRRRAASATNLYALLRALARREIHDLTSANEGARLVARFAADGGAPIVCRLEFGADDRPTAALIETPDGTEEHRFDAWTVTGDGWPFVSASRELRRGTGYETDAFEANRPLDGELFRNPLR